MAGVYWSVLYTGFEVNMVGNLLCVNCGIN